MSLIIGIMISALVVGAICRASCHFSSTKMSLHRLRRRLQLQRQQQEEQQQQEEDDVDVVGVVGGHQTAAYDIDANRRGSDIEGFNVRANIHACRVRRRRRNFSATLVARRRFELRSLTLVGLDTVNLLIGGHAIIYIYFRLAAISHCVKYR